MPGEPSAAAEVVVSNAQGLHLRPATEFARLVQLLRSTVRVESVRVEADGVQADGASVLELAMLGVAQGTTLRISAQGPGADAVVETLVRFVANGFTER